jgi:hypothetical protein
MMLLSLHFVHFVCHHHHHHHYQRPATHHPTNLAPQTSASVLSLKPLQQALCPPGCFLPSHPFIIPLFRVVPTVPSLSLS